MYQYPSSGRDTDTLRPVAGNALDPRFPPPGAVPSSSSDRAAKATGWVVGIGAFAAVLLIGMGAMANVNMSHASAAAAALPAMAAPNALTAVPVAVDPAPVAAPQAAPVVIAPPPAAAPAPAPAAEEPAAPVIATAIGRKAKKTTPAPQRHVTAAAPARPAPAPAVVRPVTPRGPSADAAATKEAQETLIKAMAERPLN